MDESYFGVKKKVKRGSIIYTDKFKAYDGLVMYGFKHERIDKSINFSNGKVYINGIEGFWSYAKERLLKFNGVSREYFVYYLKKLEFRYNFRANLDEMLYDALGGINEQLSKLNKFGFDFLSERILKNRKR